MLQRIHISEYLGMAASIPLVDVRTPAEYEKGHVPGALNIPLFSNEERAAVGTIYKQQSPDKAYDLAYEYARPRLDQYIRASQVVAPEGRVAVYCWRGGMRSKSFAEHLHANGFIEVYVIEDGYKGFRRFALESFDRDPSLLVLGGYTGSGKSKLLEYLVTRGEQVIDLEKLACHRGSAFGGIGQEPQPTTEHFANLLFMQWKALDPGRPVWLEDESLNIGKVNIPENFFSRMRSSVLFFLDIPREVRAKFLVEEYAGLDKSKLADAIRRISKRLGGSRTAEALEALETGDHERTAMLTLEYYDKTYLKGLQHRDPEKVIMVPSKTVDPERNAVLLHEAVDVSGF
jgi:tRNA 2-selenouridine synthase